LEHSVYINDLVELLRKYNITVKLFADDVKLYVKVVNITDIDELQSAEKKNPRPTGQVRKVPSQHFPPWAEDWQLSVSTDKCCVLSISKGCAPAQFYIKNLPLPEVDDCRDVGIVTKEVLSKYISDIAKKANGRENVTHRCFVSQNASLLVRAFTTYEYNSVTWSPSLKRDISLHNGTSTA